MEIYIKASDEEFGKVINLIHQIETEKSQAMVESVNTVGKMITEAMLNLNAEVEDKNKG